MDVVVLGPKGGETKIALDDGSGFRKDFLNITFVQKILGPSTETTIIQNTAMIKKSQTLLKESRENELIAKQSLEDKMKW